MGHGKGVHGSLLDKLDASVGLPGPMALPIHGLKRGTEYITNLEGLIAILLPVIMSPGAVRRSTRADPPLYV